MCGGKDRFVVFTNRPFPGWNYFCRVCTPEGGWIDQLNEQLKQPMNEERRREFAQAKQLEDAKAAAALVERMREFTTAQLWAELHRRMSEDNRQWWRERGITDDWQDYLKLGYAADKAYHHADKIYHSPAYTIPYLRQNDTLTMQYRLTEPADPGDKYRFEPGLPAAWYTTSPTEAITDKVIICEGAIKSIVTKIYLSVDESYTVLGVPSKSSWAGLENIVKDCGRVWVILDPDGQKEANNLAFRIGAAARVIDLPAKIDDMVNADELSADQFARLMRFARIPTQARAE